MADDEINHVDNEDFRIDKAVKISKKEVSMYRVCKIRLGCRILDTLYTGGENLDSTFLQPSQLSDVILGERIVGRGIRIP